MRKSWAHIEWHQLLQQSGTSVCVVLSIEGGVSQSPRVSKHEQSLAVNIQEEGAALTNFCIHWSIICKHSYLDQTKAFPVLSWARVRQHTWTEGFLSPLHEALWVLRDCALGFPMNGSKTLYTCFWSFRNAAVSEMKWCALWGFVFLCIWTSQSGILETSLCTSSRIRRTRNKTVFRDSRKRQVWGQGRYRHHSSKCQQQLVYGCDSI